MVHITFPTANGISMSSDWIDVLLTKKLSKSVASPAIQRKKIIKKCHNQLQQMDIDGETPYSKSPKENYNTWCSSFLLLNMLQQ